MSDLVCDLRGNDEGARDEALKILKGEKKLTTANIISRAEIVVGTKIDALIIEYQKK